MSRKTKIKVFKIILAILVLTLFIGITTYLFPVMKDLSSIEGQIAFKEKVKAILRNEEGLTMSQYEKLIEKIKELDNKKADKSEMIYDCIDHNMPEWAHKPVQWCLDNGIVSGTDDAHLDLNNTKLWVCVVLYRAVKFVAGLMKIKI